MFSPCNQIIYYRKSGKYPFFFIALLCLFWFGDLFLRGQTDVYQYDETISIFHFLTNKLILDSISIFDLLLESFQSILGPQV